jgi:hypothetical protein
LTDDRGHFAFQFPAQESATEQDQTATQNSGLYQRLRNLSLQAILARKPGYLDSDNGPPELAAPGHSDITILLDPECRIVGHINIPEGDTRIRVELFRHQTMERRDLWLPAGTFRIWENGEFRFFNLQAGTYRLVTDELLDRDPLTSATSEHLLGFPPVFYPGGSDFNSAGDIQLAAGATFQAEISVSRHAYYPVKIPVVNATAGQSLHVQVYPLESPSPGYALAYNPGAQMIQGSLPDGNYTVKAQTSGVPASTGILNLAVNGAPSEGASLHLVPNGEVTVRVNEEFDSGQSVFDDGAQEPPDTPRDTARPPQARIQVMLTPMEGFGLEQARPSQPSEGAQEHTLSIENVPPGRYRVDVESGVGYAARVVAGDTDLLHRLLVVGTGVSNFSIDVTLRDDGAELAGTVENSSTESATSHGTDNDGVASSYVYFVPVAGGSGQFRETFAGSDGSFMQEQLPPGTYRVVAFDRQQDGLADPSEEAMRTIESQGQLIQVTAGGKMHLTLKIVSEADSQ